MSVQQQVVFDICNFYEKYPQGAEKVVEDLIFALKKIELEHTSLLSRCQLDIEKHNDLVHEYERCQNEILLKKEADNLLENEEYRQEEYFKSNLAIDAGLIPSQNLDNLET